MERPLRMHLLSSAVCVQPVRRSERCALRPGNVHSADGWEGLLKPVVSRYRGKLSRINFRADAGFANPEVYEFLEGEGIRYAIRLPANRVLQERIGYLLKRPVGRPSLDVRRSYTNFTYQAGSWTKPRRVVAKVEWHPGELYPRVGFIVTNMARPAQNVVAFYNKRGPASSGSKRARARFDGRGCHAARSPPTPCGSNFMRSPIISQLPAHAGDARTNQGLVADEAQRETHQDWREGRAPRPLCRLPDGRGRRSETSVRRHPSAHRGPTAAAAHVNSSVISSIYHAFQEKPWETPVLINKIRHV